MARIAGESPRAARHIKLSPMGTVDPVILCCEIAGDGPPVILIPGLGDTVWVWRHLSHLLQPRSRVLAPELRGHGRSASPAGPYNAEEMAVDLVRLTESLGLKRPTLIGQGFGAHLILNLAIEHPDFPAGIVLIGAETGPPGGETIAELIELAARGDMAAAYKIRKEIAPSPRGMPPRERAEHHRLFLRNDPAGFAAACAAALGAPDTAERLGEIKCPALAVAGEFDESRHEDAAQLAERISVCTAAIINGAGHFAHLDAPESFQIILDDFLMEHALIAPPP
jgi:pimeloyl-ACP methyl ester carboxylesterase